MQFSIPRKAMNHFRDTTKMVISAGTNTTAIKSLVSPITAVGKQQNVGGAIMIDLSKMTVDELKHAIWIDSTGSVPKGGLPIDRYRDELERRTGSRKGWHED